MLTELLRKRPLAFSLFVLLLTNFLIQYLFLPSSLLWWTLLPVSLSILLLALLRKNGELKRLRAALILTLTAVLVATALGAYNNAERERIAEDFNDAEINATFKVRSVRQTNGVALVKGTLTPDGEDDSYQTVLCFFSDTLILLDGDRYLPLERGDIFTGCFQLSYIDGKTLSELSDYADGYTLTGSYLHSATLIRKGSGEPSLRERLGELFDTTLSADAAALMRALLISDKTALSPDVRSDFTVLGISHLLAVSGLHLTVLVGLFAFLLERTRIDRRARYLILTGIILLYALLTDFAPSLLRAGGMLLFFYLSESIGRHRDTVTSLFTATSLITLFSRRAILDIGLLLSFLATLGILILGAPVLRALYRELYQNHGEPTPTRPSHRIRRALLSSVTLTLSATLFTLPLLLLISGELFLLVALSHFIFAPLVTLLLYAIPLFIAVVRIPILNGIVTVLIELLAKAIVKLSRIAQYCEGLTFSLDYRFMPYLLAALALPALFLLLRQRKVAAFCVLASFLLLAPIGIGIDYLALQHTQSVAYLSDKKNDLVFVEYRTHRLAAVFSDSASFVQKELQNGRLTSPSVSCDTVLLATPSENDVSLLLTLWTESDVTRIILPDHDPDSAALSAVAETLGFAVTRYQPNETVVYNGIPIETHASTSGDTYAITVTLADESITYIRENAPNDFDIRFGVLREERDILIHGAYGGEMKGSLSPDADELWEYEPRGYIPQKDGQAHRYGNRAERERE